jgi:hypothetical protein
MSYAETRFTRLAEQVVMGDAQFQRSKASQLGIEKTAAVRMIPVKTVVTSGIKHLRLRLTNCGSF